jgi:hypothetical protein
MTIQFYYHALIKIRVDVLHRNEFVAQDLKRN